MKRMVDEKEVVRDIEAVEGGIKVLQLDGTSKTVEVGGSSTVDWDDIQDKPNFATVATSGDYDDLTNKPSIPAAQIQSDWIQADDTSVDYIKNKPTIPAAVSGVNDGTNWTSITIGDTTKAIPSGGSSSITLVGTAGSESISDGTTTLNVMTRDTDQTITGVKKFEHVPSSSLDAGIKINLYDSASERAGIQLTTQSTEDDFYNWVISGFNGDIKLRQPAGSKYLISDTNFSPDGVNGLNLGQDSNGNRWNNLYLVGNLSDGTNSISVANIATGLAEANPTVPSGTTPTALTGLKVGSNYYSISGGGGSSALYMHSITLSYYADDDNKTNLYFNVYSTDGNAFRTNSSTYELVETLINKGYTRNSADIPCIVGFTGWAISSGSAMDKMMSLNFTTGTNRLVVQVYGLLTSNSSTTHNFYLTADNYRWTSSETIQTIN